ncbi:hypothetical protein [Streptomyces sp. SYP-A7185]|uniref:hypothetical protein n=1 Tax=Streptomyces sp. SYP-A7185 TaxID=3040076 RepID=UPI0038F68B91
MASDWNWENGEGLLGLDSPAEWDAAYERGERRLGTAAIGLAFNCPLREASPRILRAMRLPDPAQRGFAYTAAGTAARLNGELTPELYAALRAEGHHGIAAAAVDDTLDYVPFRQLPPWFKWRTVASKAEDKLKTWHLTLTYATEDARNTLRRRRS